LLQKILPSIFDRKSGCDKDSVDLRFGFMLLIVSPICIKKDFIRELIQGQVRARDLRGHVVLAKPDNAFDDVHGEEDGTTFQMQVPRALRHFIREMRAPRV